MICKECGSLNDESGASFCAACGKPLTIEVPRTASRGKRFIAIAAMAIAFLAAAAVGYYKFVLPRGVAAYVNGERIMIAELEEETARVMAAQRVPVLVSDSPAAKAMRSEVLNRMIAERVALQEARAAGIQVQSTEISETIRWMQASSGLDDAGFDAAVNERYGSRKVFEQRIERDLAVRKFFTEKVIPMGADPATAGAAVNRWLQMRTRNASVRIALAEQVSGAGCGCCNNGPGRGGPGASAGKEQAAAEAGLRYWNERKGEPGVTARTKDFGCHVQVDIVKKERVLLSLRFQDGTITEL